jgi:hypothetical protein
VRTSRLSFVHDTAFFFTLQQKTQFTLIPLHLLQGVPSTSFRILDLRQGVSRGGIVLHSIGLLILGVEFFNL